MYLSRVSYYELICSASGCGVRPRMRLPETGKHILSQVSLHINISPVCEYEILTFCWIEYAEKKTLLSTKKADRTSAEACHG